MTTARREAERAQKKRWREANPEKARERKRQDYERHREARIAANVRAARANPEAARARLKRFHEAHPEKEKEYGARYRELHREAVKEMRARSRRKRAAQIKEEARLYKLAHPDKVRDEVQRYQARKRGAAVEPVERRKVWDRDDGICGICGEAADPTRWHLDHVIPLSRGGAHSYDNTQVAHPFCNLSKGDRPA